MTTETLKNGAEVLQRSQDRLGHDLVLCKWWGLVPYVVWRVDPSGFCYWGRYFKSLADAASHFESRVKHLMEYAG